MNKRKNRILLGMILVGALFCLAGAKDARSSLKRLLSDVSKRYAFMLIDTSFIETIPVSTGKTLSVKTTFEEGLLCALFVNAGKDVRAFDVKIYTHRGKEVAYFDEKQLRKMKKKISESEKVKLTSQQRVVFFRPSYTGTHRVQITMKKAKKSKGYIAYALGFENFIKVD